MQHLSVVREEGLPHSLFLALVQYEAPLSLKYNHDMVTRWNGDGPLTRASFMLWDE